MVRDRALAEDLAQEAFIRAFNAIFSYDPRYKFSGWIFKIANNHTIDHLRRCKLDTVSIDGSPHARTAQEEEQRQLVVASTDENPQEYVEHRELGDQIEQAIGKLRLEYRTAVLLRHVEGYAYDEISQIMDLPLGTVKTYLHRARGELKEMLARVSVDMGLGSLVLRFPRGLGVRLVKDTFFTSLDSEGLVKRGDTYYSLDYDEAEYQITVDVDAAFGSIRVAWVD